MKFQAFEPIDLKDDFSVARLLLTQVVPDANQPRKKFDKVSLIDLANSIKQHGVLQPIIVRQIDTARYQIIAGERRWRASSMAGLEVIPAIIQTGNSQDDVAISLIENIQRKDLNPIELAEAYYQLSNNHGLSHEAIAAMVSKSRAGVTNFLRLLNLSQEVKVLLIDGKLEMGHARSLLTLPLEEQVIFAHKVIEKKLTVRGSEELVQLYKYPKKKTNPYANEINAWVKKLSDSLSSKVSININEKGEGKVVIHFSSSEELDGLIEQLIIEKQI